MAYAQIAALLLLMAMIVGVMLYATVPDHWRRFEKDAKVPRSG